MTPIQQPISIIVPTYNGKALLEECFPSVWAAVGAYNGNVEIIVVDNGSTDDTIPFMRQHYPEVKIIENKRNEGFARAVNKGVKAALSDIVLLLNNDIRVERDFIEPLLRHFNNASVFAVVSKSLVALGGHIANESVTVPGFADGLIFSHQPCIHGKDPDLITGPCTNFHASGGFSAFDRNKFLALGGFDTMYHPFYYEDVDLSYQAWKRGWVVLYEPTSVVYHHSHATTRRIATDRFISKIELRNRILLTWKNVADPLFVRNHFTWLRRLVIKSLVPSHSSERYIMGALFTAICKLPAILFYRVRNANYATRSDSYIFDLAANKDTPHLKFDRLFHTAIPEHITGPRVLLIDPPGYQRGINVGLAYLAGAFRKSGYGHVDILDLNNVMRDVSHERIAEYVAAKQYDIIGVSIKTPTYRMATELSQCIKQKNPAVILIAGGAHITLNCDEFMREHQEFDYAIIGEGDESFIELCRMVQERKDRPIPGVFSRNAYNGAFSAAHLIADLNTLPLPDFSAFKEYDFNNFEYPLVTSRGCPYQCIYCSVGMISGNKMRFREVENVIAELKWAKKQFNCSRFNIIDDNFTIDITRAKYLCDRIVEENLAFTWVCGNGIRADRVDAELAVKMKRAGCVLVCVGVENADPNVFNRIKKGETLADIKRGVRFLKEAGIEVVGFFIIGLPGDNRKSAEKALDFIKESRLDSARFGLLLPYPKTEAYDFLLKTGTFLKNYKEGIHFSDTIEPVFETKDFSAAEMVATYEKLYTRLRYFTFLMPQETSELEKLKRVLRLLWQYDKVGFIIERIKAMASVPVCH